MTLLKLFLHILLLSKFQRLKLEFNSCLELSKEMLVILLSSYENTSK